MQRHLRKLLPVIATLALLGCSAEPDQTTTPTDPSPTGDAMDHEFSCFSDSVQDDHPRVDSYLGLTEDQLRTAAGEAGHTVRVLARDGECPDAITQDLREDRVNVAFHEGEVVGAVIF